MHMQMPIHSCTRPGHHHPSGTGHVRKGAGQTDKHRAVEQSKVWTGNAIRCYGA